MTKSQEERATRDIQILDALKQVPQRSYLDIMVEFRVSETVVQRIAHQNGIRRGPGGKAVN